VPGVADKKDGAAWWRISFIRSWLRARNPRHRGRALSRSHEGIRPGREGDRKPKSRRAPCRTNRPTSEGSRLTDAGEVDDLVEPLGASFERRPTASPPNQDAPFSGERLDQRGVDYDWLNREPRSTSATCRGLHRGRIDEPFVSCVALSSRISSLNRSSPWFQRPGLGRSPRHRRRSDGNRQRHGDRVCLGSERVHVNRARLTASA
jgi:hypothetical protein